MVQGWLRDRSGLGNFREALLQVERSRSLKRGNQAHYFMQETRRLVRDRAFHDPRLVAPGEQAPEDLVPSIEATRAGAQQPFHPGDQIGMRRLDHQMRMIRHEDVSVNLPARFGASLAEGLDEARAIRLVVEDGPAPVARFMT